MQLAEYRPGRYAWIDAGGAVVRRATVDEVDRELAGRVLVPVTTSTRATAGTNGDGKAAVATVDDPAPAVDWRGLQAGAARCSACGAVYPGYRCGTWQIDGTGKIERGRLFHWCSGGRPGIWQPAEIVQKGGD